MSSIICFHINAAEVLIYPKIWLIFFQMSLVLIFMVALVGGITGNIIGDSASIGLQPDINIRTNINQWFPFLPFSTLMRKPFGRKRASQVVRNYGNNDYYQKEEENFKMALQNLYNKYAVPIKQLSMVDRLIR